MKARVKATGNIIEVEKTILRGEECYIQTIGEKIGSIYMKYELDFSYDCDYDPDYWTRLEHQYAGMAMQGMLNNSLLITGLLKVNKSHEDIVAEVTGTAIRYAHTLIQQLKEKEERK